jgi:hypothetical protein
MSRPKYPQKTRCYRTRGVYFTERDELAFGRVLREFSPRVIFFENDRRTALSVCIPNIPASCTECVEIFMPPPGQESSWIAPPDWVQGVKQNSCRFTFTRGGWASPGPPPPGRRWLFDWPFPSRSEFVAWFPCHDINLKRFSTKVLRLIDKIVSKPPSDAGLDADGWRNARETLTYSVRGEYPIDPEAPILSSNSYNDALWDDRLPEVSTLPRVSGLEAFFERKAHEKLTGET